MNEYELITYDRIDDKYYRINKKWTEISEKEYWEKVISLRKSDENDR